MASFLDELKRRRVFRVGAAYLVVAWLLLQFTDIVFDNLGAPQWVMQAIMLVLAIGFPAAVVLAWAFEAGPDGVRRDDDAVSSSNTRKFYALVALLLVVAIGILGWRFLIMEDEAVVGDIGRDDSFLAVAVLPFESFSEQSEDQYFADGLADTLLHKLATLQTLTVIARNSSFQFKGQNVDVREVGEILGVPTVVEGSVQRRGDQIRVIAQLVSTSDGAHWWSGTFEDTFDNVFELQDRIAAAIVEQLQITLTQHDRDRLYRNGTTNPEAYDTLMRADAIDSSLDDVRYDPDNDPKLKLLQQVVEIDPDYALGWVRLSDYYNMLAFRDVNARLYDEFAAAAMQHATRAIEIDPEEEEGYVSLGFAFWRRQDTTQAEQNYRKALSLNPNNADALAGLGLALLSRSPTQAYELFSRAQQINPTSTVVYRQLYFSLTSLRRLDEAIARLEEGIARAPDAGILYDDLGDAYINFEGRRDKAAAITSSLLRRQPDSRIALEKMAQTWLSVGDVERARRWIDRFVEQSVDASAILDEQVKISLLDGDVEAASQLVGQIPEQGLGIVNRGINQIIVCKRTGDDECVTEYMEKITGLRSGIESRGGAIPPFIEAILDLLTGFVGGSNDPEARQKLESVVARTANWPVYESGGPDSGARHFLRASALTQLGRTEEALAELDYVLENFGAGIVATDSLGLQPAHSLYFEPLRELPGFDDWLQRHESRVAAMRETMVEMEADGRILRP